MNDLRLLLHADKDRKIIILEFKYQITHLGKSITYNLCFQSFQNSKICKAYL